MKPEIKVGRLISLLNFLPDYEGNLVCIKQVAAKVKVNEVKTTLGKEEMVLEISQDECLEGALFEAVCPLTRQNINIGDKVLLTTFKLKR